MIGANDLFIARTLVLSAYARDKQHQRVPGRIRELNIENWAT